MLTAPSFKRGMSFNISIKYLKFCTKWISVFCKFTQDFFFPGLYELTLDNKTISGQTVNIVQLLFLYPELATSFIYRITSSHVSIFTDCYFKASTIRTLAIINHTTIEKYYVFYSASTVSTLVHVWLIWVVGLWFFLVAYTIQTWFHTFVFFWKSFLRSEFSIFFTHVWCSHSPVACCGFKVWKFFEHSGKN